MIYSFKRNGIGLYDLQLTKQSASILLILKVLSIVDNADTATASIATM